MEAAMDDRAISQAVANPPTYVDQPAYDALFPGLRRDSPLPWPAPHPHPPLRPSPPPSHPLETQPPPNRQKVEGRVAALARGFVGRMAGLDGECDFVRDVANWYPLRVIMTILGVPAEDEPLMLRLTQELLGSSDPEMKRSGARRGTYQDFFDYFARVTADRRRTPRDDVATVIANAEIDGKPIGEREAMSYYVVIATAGHDTTSSTTAGGLLALLQHPDALARLRAEPSLLPTAVEEMVRWVSPVKHFFRTATEDYVLRGQNIKAGDSLMMCYPSGNRDEEVFSDPFRFQIDRSPNRHLAFAFGPHLFLP